VCEKAAEEMLDDLIGELTRPLANEETVRIIREKRSSRFVCTGTLEEVNQYFYERECTDGLPIIPPTEEAVEEMLTGTDFPPDRVVATVLPELRQATVEKIGINAVMAGCLPTHMPVLLAAVEAVMDPDFHLVEVNVSAGSYTPFMIVNGPIRVDLGINCKHGALSPGRRANAALGRALRLILLNCGRALPGVQDMGVLGSPGKYTQCVGENEEESPWNPLHVERGSSPESSTVSLLAITARAPVHGGDTPEITLEPLARAAALRPNSSYLGTHILVVLAPDTAELFSDAGWTKEDIQRHLYEHARHLPTSLYGLRHYTPSGRRSVKFYLDKEMAEWIFAQEGTSTPIPIVAGPDRFVIVVFGGHGQKQNAVFPGGHGQMVTKQVILPARWGELVEKYKVREIGRFRS
jgi:hypothetical protein